LNELLIDMPVKLALGEATSSPTQLASMDSSTFNGNLALETIDFFFLKSKYQIKSYHSTWLFVNSDAALSMLRYILKWRHGFITLN
jgi:hypothetical protein